LYEIKPVQEPSDKVIDTLNKTIGLKICDLPYSQMIAEAIQQTWTILLLVPTRWRGNAVTTRQRRCLLTQDAGASRIGSHAGAWEPEKAIQQTWTILYSFPRAGVGMQ
jgi:hypothetical protein